MLSIQGGKEIQRRTQQAKEKEFYVFDTLASFRAENIPEACKEQNLCIQRKEKFKPTDFFTEWPFDEHEISRKCSLTDCKSIRFTEICFNDPVDIQKTTELVVSNF